MNEANSSGTPRNSPCPCGSGLKYKRCHGLEYSEEKMKAQAQAAAAKAQMGDFDPSQMDPEWIGQFSQAMKRLPRGQMMRLQQMMQKAMAGQDVSQEAAALEKSLPPEFQELLKNAPMPTGMEQLGGQDLSQVDPANMTEEQAREILRQAEASGSLTGEHKESEAQKPKSGGFWSKLRGK